MTVDKGQVTEDDYVSLPNQEDNLRSNFGSLRSRSLRAESQYDGFISGSTKFWVGDAAIPAISGMDAACVQREENEFRNIGDILIKTRRC